MIKLLIRKYHKLRDPRFEFPDYVTHVDIANHIADLLAQGWTQGHNTNAIDARDSQGNEVSYKSKDAVEYSCNGAIDYIFYKFKTVKQAQKESWLIRFAIYLINDVDTEKWSAFDKNKYPEGFRLFLWNNHPEQTQENVVKAFRDYADKVNKSTGLDNLVR